MISERRTGLGHLTSVVDEGMNGMIHESQGTIRVAAY
jgi:hypothetical protein